MGNPYLSERTKNIPVSGIRVIFDKAQRMKDVVRLEMGDPDFDTPSHIREAAKRALDEGYTHYTPSAGLTEIREAVAEKLRRDNRIDVGPDEVVMTAGSSSAINIAIMATINPGDEVLIPDPAWPLYEVFVKLSGGVVVRYPLLEKNEFKIDPEDVERRITRRTKMLIINTPNNPTGSVQTRLELEAIAQIALENDLLVVSDEVYEKITHSGAEHLSIGSMPEMRDRTITVNSFSKTYAMTGWRIGYAAANREIATEMVKLNIYSTVCVNAVAQRAALAALRGPQDCVREMVGEYGRRRDYVVRRLNEMPRITCVEPKGAFYVFPNISDFGVSSFDFSMNLLDMTRVSTVPGSSFGERGEGYIRISYATSLKELEKGMGRIEDAIKRKML
ncbi:MAG: pyridoxal phosphate-dependent aminotransferase [Candidatus Geothermarchaeales archaeon]